MENGNSPYEIDILRGWNEFLFVEFIAKFIIHSEYSSYHQEIYQVLSLTYNML